MTTKPSQRTTVADVLLGVYADASGAARGVVHHDVRFGNETDDVVAELTATMGDEPIAFRQIGTHADALQIEANGRVHRVSFDRGGLDAVAHWINAQLEGAGARRRIFTVDTLADHCCYVVCTPQTLEAMKARGLLGFGAP